MELSFLLPGVDFEMGMWSSAGQADVTETLLLALEYFGKRFFFPKGCHL